MKYFFGQSVIFPSFDHYNFLQINNEMNRQTEDTY